jgi:predicted flap endonuclease-1-like 5' DNA nuclease
MWDWSIVSVIWFCLAIAAVLGFFIGWLLKKLSCEKKCGSLYADLSAKDEELARLRASLSKAKGDASSENTKDDAEIANLKAQIKTLEGNSAKLEADWKAKHSSLEADWSNKYGLLQTDFKTKADAENTKDDGEIAALKAQIKTLEGNLVARGDLDAEWKAKHSSLDAEWSKKYGLLQADLNAKTNAAPVVVEKIVEKIVEKPVEVIKEVPVNNDSAWTAKFAALENDLKVSHERQYTLESDLKRMESTSKASTGSAAKGGAALAMSGGNHEEVAKLNAEIKTLKEKLEETEGEKVYLLGRVKKAESGEVRKVVPMDQRDDLELIHGVGPVIEGMLYDEGIYFFKDVAGWDDAKIDEISAKLPRFKNRIRRENWIDSAKEEHFKKYGEKL